MKLFDFLRNKMRSTFASTVAKAMVDKKAMVDEVKTEADQQREALVKQGEEQFQKLINKGLRVPVALL